ncbi:MAG: pyridoxamine 5'-phosphate oxidase family protein [Dehalococcoidia bacterium]
MSGGPPRASRPTRPAGYWRPRPLPWEWARHRLIEARNYWIASILPGGRPHSRPVWGTWLDDCLYFDTGSRIGTNLAANPEVTVHLESADEVVIVEGIAVRVSDAQTIQAFFDAYNAKYNGDLTELPGVLFKVTPRAAFGWLCDPTNLDRGAIFGSTGTRWDFD